ncbi:MAG: hypothetical protein A3G91_00815 [Omnitrophica WOR_2 bacterium RIFCSPLOWO2_12_FULL_50_9]|nr:MAG: hypothetical protein A3D87_02780 [Omnitrophica WOR_2 bacterium RIFCSPHIGHO2_02_FULL_50_17]OGX43447.1 MAG: hypothetical protein A3G91_00815 [Omnitrophica WOR_2 bacterium RIFCSPLOWO2_12_FULL_50_9]
MFRKTRKKIFQSPQGFTLVEVLIAVGILAIVIVGLLQLFVSCSALAEAAGNTTFALNEAQNKMEEIRNHDFDSIATDYASGGTPGNTFTLSTLNGTGTVATSQVGGSSELLQIGIDVSWQNKNGRSFSTTLTGLIAQR